MTDPPPAVTVVVPAYNSARWVGETLASVAAQTVGPAALEVVVVDDGSTDGTADAAERYLSATALRWRVIRQPNRGPGAARNAGYRAGRAAWVQFLDADDLIDPEKVAIQLAAARAADDSTAAVYSSWQKFGLIDPRWELGHPVTPGIGEEDTVLDLLRDPHGIATGSQLYARRWLDRVGGWDEEHRNGEDHELMLRVGLAGGRFRPVPAGRPLFFYRRHGTLSSLTTQSGRANAEVGLRLAWSAAGWWRARGDLTPDRAAFLARRIGGSARWLADYDWPAARAWARRAHDLDPGYRPEWSGRFRLLAGVVGTARAMWLAAKVRGLLRQFRARPPAHRLVTIDPPTFRPTAAHPASV